MKLRFATIILSCFAFFGAIENSNAQAGSDTSTTVKIFRLFGKELFDANAVPFIQPLVTSINATSNARFFNQARVPKKVETPYFRFGVHGMMGFVRDDQKTFKPSVPTRKTLDLVDVAKYGNSKFVDNKFEFEIVDTAGLVNELLKYVLYKADQQGELDLPEDAATIFGNLERSIPFPSSVLLKIVKEEPLFKQLSPAAQESITNSFNNLPDRSFPLPRGQNMSYLVAAVPQLEVGSLFGTELLVRYIPPIVLDTSVGKFAFWGIGLKHSITQYFEEPSFDAAIQAVYQGTSLENKVGVTGAVLKADGTIWNMNIHASKHFEGIVDIFGGFSFETLSIDASYTYLLPQEIQNALGIVDTKPQTSPFAISDTNYKAILGISRQFGPIAIFADYSISKFNIFSGGIEARF
ncbi:MAG: DUF6588 family protein [Bacteroidota bacterium]